MAALAVAPLAPHTVLTCGLSRKGGLETSNSRRRSNLFGRVAVTHVQGSPKGGGALGLLGVSNTRLSPVPPLNQEARMCRWKLGCIAVLCISLVWPWQASAQDRAAQDALQ